MVYLAESKQVLLMHVKSQSKMACIRYHVCIKQRDRTAPHLLGVGTCHKAYHNHERFQSFERRFEMCDQCNTDPECGTAK